MDDRVRKDRISALGCWYAVTIEQRRLFGRLGLAAMIACFGLGLTGFPRHILIAAWVTGFILIVIAGLAPLKRDSS